MIERSATASQTHGRDPYNLPISKLRGVPNGVRLALKAEGINTAAQLLEAAGRRIDRQALAARVRIGLEQLEEVVCRADLMRVHGIGAMFGLMLEQLGVRKVGDLAVCDPGELHERLCDHNQTAQLARRSPTPEEVAGWVAQARALPKLVG